MTVSEEAFALAAEFPAASREQWQRLVEGVLAKSGKPGRTGLAAEQALATEVEDGLRVQPLYTAQDAVSDGGGPDPGWPGFAPFVRGGRAQGRFAAGPGWDVRQQHAHPDPGRTNEAILADLENGVTSLWLTVGGSGLPVAALPDVLEGVFLDLAGVILDAGADFAAAAEQLFALYATGPAAIPASAGTGNLGADPLGLLARTGQDADIARQLAQAALLAARCASEFPGVRALTVDALPYHDAGASAAQELGLSMSTAVAYLRELTQSGLTADQAAGQLEFRYAAVADQFLTIAKLRAARRLWSRVAEACGIASEGAAQRQHAVTSTVMMTERDPWVNMLRTTVACMGAGVGGADAITVLPFDSALGLPDDFARRIARNTQAILLDETNLARVVDPAGGSWYVEQLTDQLARAAWDWFQQAERAGGQHAALRSGLIAERIEQNWAKRSANLARRREPITGVSEFPNLGEQPVIRDPAPARPGGGLPRVRRAAAFEALRSRSDALLAATGARPKIMLAALGPAAVHTARSSFAANLFQAGGIETPLFELALCEAAGGSTTEKPDLQALAAAFTASGARVACICSSDALYAEYAEAAAAALKAAGARRVVLAGRPGDRREAYQSAGVDDFGYAGGDAVATLTTVFDVSTTFDESGAS
ncbi:MAG: methylmalonyl-CoA mutase small subunit [Actinomycetia bacterium]|nr:methylmalonyl-CoA mutase small subunit [Actinomycetes bacterium]